MSNLRVFRGPNELAQFAAQQVIEAAAAAIAQRNRFILAVSGGSTPRGLYQLLAESPQNERVDWQRTHLFWVDERCVGMGHASSNYRLAAETLLKGGQVNSENIHRMRGELPAEQAANQYDAEIRRFFKIGSPQETANALFDLAVMGLGADGHTASLFPQHPALRIRERWAAGVAHNTPPDPAVDRITLTVPALQRARQMVFLVSGCEKAEKLRQTLAAPPEDADLPATWVNGGNGEVSWLVDREAASRLAPPEAGIEQNCFPNE